MKATRVLPTLHCVIESSGQFCTLTLNHLPQPMTDPAWCGWFWEAAESRPPTPGHWGQQSECSTFRTSGHVTTMIVTRIQHQERPHQHHLQDFKWQMTQLLKQKQHNVAWLFMLTKACDYECIYTHAQSATAALHHWPVC